MPKIYLKSFYVKRLVSTIGHHRVIKTLKYSFNFFYFDTLLVLLFDMTCNKSKYFSNSVNTRWRVSKKKNKNIFIFSKQSKGHDRMVIKNCFQQLYT